MKNLVVKIRCKNGEILNYLHYPYPFKDVFKLQRKMRIKRILYGELFAVYHPDMNFSNSEIIEDRRSEING